MASRADISAGKAFVELYAKSDSLAHGLADARRRIQDFGTAAALVGAAIAAAGVAIVAPIGRAIGLFTSLGSELNDMSKRTGVAASALAELKFAAEQSGAELSDVEIAIRNVQKTLVAAEAGSKGAKESLAAIGLTANQLKGKLPDQQLQMIADRLAKIQDPAKRAAIAVDLLGKAGAQLLPMVDDLAALRAEARRLGLVPTDKAVKDAAAIGNLFAKIKSVAFAAVFEIGSAVGPLLLPILETVKDVGASFALWVRNNGDIVRMVAKIGAGLIAAGTAISAFGTGLNLAGRGMGILQAGLAFFQPFIAPVRLASLALQNLRSVTGSVGTVANQAFRGMTAAMTQAASSASGMVSSIATAGWRMAASLGAATVAAGLSLYHAIYGQVTRLAAQAPAAFNRIGQAARSGLAVATSAAATFGREAAYWLARPLQYFRAIAPIMATDLQDAFSRAMSRIRNIVGIAADGVRAAWSSATAAVSSAVNVATAFVAARWSAVANPVTASIVQAWTAMSAAVSSRVNQAWNNISARTGELATRIKTFLGPVLPMLQQDFGRIAGYARTAFSATVGVARSTAAAIVGAFRYAGPAIASGLTSAVGGAFARIRAMGTSTASFLARGMGGAGRGLSGLLSGGAGMLGMMGAGAGGMLGSLAGVVPQLLLIGSSLGMLLNPATLLIGAIAAGVYLWTRYSDSGRAALANVTAAMAPFVAIARSTFAGVADAIKAGDLTLAGQIAMAGLKLSFVTGMEALGEAIGGTWGKAVADIGGQLASGDFAGAWATTVKGMAAIWDAWSEGVVKTFTSAISSIVDAWKNGVGAISDFLLEASAAGGALGRVASGILGVNMQDEKQRAALMQEKERAAAIRNQQFSNNEFEKSLAAARASGNAADIARFERALATGKAKLADLQGGATGPDFMQQAKQEARDIVGGTADAINETLREIDRDAEARNQANNDDLTAALPTKTSDAVAKAQAELDALVAKAAAQRKEVEQKKEAEKNAFDLQNAGGGLAESKNVAGTFSAAAAIALGQGAGAKPEVQVARDQLREQKELVKAAFANLRKLEMLEKNTRKFTARAGK